jgi:hypothetical protein
MFRRIVLVFGLFLAAIYFILISGYTEAQNPNADPRCEGLRGAAYGMRIAPTAIGCDDPDTAPPGCTEIEENFTQITGEPPPWVSPICPCFVSETIDEFFAGYENELAHKCNGTECGREVGLCYLPQLRLRGVEVGTGVPSGPTRCITVKDDVEVEINPITPAEAQVCSDEVKRIIATYIGTPVDTISNDPNGV